MSNLHTISTIPVMTRWFMIFASLLGALGVASGAYASHGLSNWASPEQVDIFKTAVSYQLFHTLTLLFVCLFSLFYQSTMLLVSQFCFTFGIILFSGSLYCYVFTGVKVLGAITPVGGLLLISAWLLLGLSLFFKPCQR
ncbi:DUF423 domain-containing protein [Psychromonas sp. MME1]|uniref:DUF423 domain-containing protein n=1 Tax=Psychromonas sp. MME1 TaxID=3231032 RepID=UPI0034E1B2A8